MTLYLIAHKVRGEPTFDIARKACPGAPCQPNCGLWDGEVCRAEVEEWWEIPTSGHRAYPYWFCELAKFGCNELEETLVRVFDNPYEIELDPPPSDWPDHYTCNDRDHKPLPTDVSLTSILSHLFTPRPTIKRRV